jgi:8-oxo-dGTP pyrophosphatase MutT (NUDIX family)
MTLAERLRAALADPRTMTAPLLTGDSVPFDPAAVASAAAVLIAITDQRRPGLILTQRNANLRNHAGQIAFPGGRIDPGDRDAVDAALREAEEEIALPRQRVDVVGTTDSYRTVTGFDLTPVLGVVPAGLALVPTESEVADVFEVPLDFLLDAANHAERRAEYLGGERRYYEIRWEDRRIWGATAAIIVNLSRRLQWPA